MPPTAIPDQLTTVARRVRDELRAARILRDAGFLQLDPPARFVSAVKATRAYGPIGSMVVTAALRAPDRPAVVDERGTVTFAELDRRSNALANAWRARGIRPGDGVALLLRNHRGLHDAFFAVQKTGAKAIFLNTDFAGPQLREVSGREGARMLVYDEEYAEMVGGLDLPLGEQLGWTDDPAHPEGIEAAIASGDPSPPPAPSAHGTFVILTSGTTGTPKGANRGSAAGSLTPMGALLGSVPIRSQGTTLIWAPMFHSLGLANAIAAVALQSTVVVRRRYAPEDVLADLERHRADGLVLVPIMLQRLLEAHDAAPDKPDLGALRWALVAGSQLGAPLARRALDTIGDVIYNLYGSTEVAYATIAGPEHLRINPATVGPPTLGTRIRLVDEHGRDVPRGQTGRIFVANAIPFEGYTGGGHKEVIDGLMSSGDVGHFDEHGLLYIDGRDDAMIVSGGENVFPDEIEELLTGHPDIDEASALGVEDETFGQRLRVFVVRAAGAELGEEDVKAYVRDNLARFKVPRDVVFLDELPRNPTGKVLKRELLKIEP